MPSAESWEGFVTSIAENAASYFVDRHQEEGRGDKLAFREAGSGRTLSYKELAEGTSLCAGALIR